MRVKTVKFVIISMVLFGLFVFSDSKISADDGISDFDFSSFGRLAYVERSDEDGSSDILVWDADTDWNNGRKVKIELGDTCEGDDQKTPALSRDGEWLAIATQCDLAGLNPDGYFWIAVVNMSNLAEWYPMTIGSDYLDYSSMNPTWNPSGSRIAFDSDISGESRIYSMDVFNQINSAAEGKVTALKALTDEESWDPYWAPDGGVIAVAVPGGVARVWIDDPNLKIISNHSGSDSDVSSSPIVIRSNFGKPKEIIPNWRIPGLIIQAGENKRINCDPRAEFFAYVTDGHVSGDGPHDNDDGTSKIIVTCEHGMDEKTPPHVTQNQTFATYSSSQGGDQCCISFYPEISPDGRFLAYTSDNGQIMVRKFGDETAPNREVSAHFANNSDVHVWMETGSSPFSWSNYTNPLPQSDSPLALEVGAIGLSVDVGGGVNQIFGSQETIADQYDKQIQLEINRINSYRKELDFWLESELKRLQFEKDQWESDNATRVEEENRGRIEGTKRGWEQGIADNKRQMDYELERFDEDSKYALQEREQNLENFLNNDRPQRIEEMEQSQAWQIQDADRRRENDKADLVRWRDENISNSQRYWKEETDYIKMYYQDLINDAIHRDDQSAVNDHMRERDHNIEDYEEYLQNELNGHHFTYDDELNNRNRNWAREDQDRVRDFESEKQNVMQDLDQQEEGFQRDIDNFLEEQARSREQMRSRFEMNILNQQEQAAMELESAEAEASNRLEMLDMERQRMQAQWQMREEQLNFEYESQQADFDRQVDEVMFNAEMDKQRFEMDQEQMEMEMQMMQDEISLREQDTDFMFNENMEGLKRDAEERMHEIDRRREEEGWSEEEYSNALAQYDEWYFNREFEIQSDYDQDMRDIQFDQRQYENFQSVVEQNEIYDDGARGFFGNPVAGSIRQGGFEENLEDPGFLAMIGIIITVGTTLFQVVRGK